jgi:GMP synthase (glutamine-hydrolysing)
MILIVNNHSRNVPLIKDILKKYRFKFAEKDQKSLFRNLDSSKIKGVILSGGRPQLDQRLYFNKIRADVSCLINYDVPILGICEGHEIIAEACGGEVVKLRNPSRYASLRVKILKNSKIFKGLPEHIEVYEEHSRYARSLPKELVVSASSRKDTIEGLFHKNKPIFGVQFHPERSGEHGEKIIKNFLDICRDY